MLSKKVKKYISKRKIMLAMWNCESQHDPYTKSRWYLPFKDIAKDVILFDTNMNRKKYGEQKMNKMLLQKIDIEKPNIIVFLPIVEELDPACLVTIRQDYPKIKTICVFGDDSWRYESYSKRHAIFFDYIVTILSKEGYEKHKKAGHKVFLSHSGVNTEEYRPLNLEKIYDVGFIGGASYNRVQQINYLLKYGIDVHVWGRGWKRKLIKEENYHGPLDTDKWSETVCQTKINLNFSLNGDGEYQVKGRPWELGACKGFVISDNCQEYLDYFSENEIVLFNTKDELLVSIYYYLENEKERNKIANEMYKKILKKYSLSEELNKIMEKIMKDSKK